MSKTNPGLLALLLIGTVGGMEYTMQQYRHNIGTT